MLLKRRTPQPDVTIQFIHGCQCDDGHVARRGDVVTLPAPRAAFYIAAGRARVHVPKDPDPPGQEPPPKPSREKATTGHRRETATASE